MTTPIAPVRIIQGIAPGRSTNRRVAIVTPVGGSEQANEDAERDDGGEHAQAGGAARWDRQVQHVAGDRAHDADRGAGRDESRRHQGRRDALRKLLKHEDAAADRGVKGDRQTRAGAGGMDGDAICRRAKQPRAAQRTDRCAHLNGRAFTAERETGADGQQAAEEFHRDGGESCRPGRAPDYRFDMLHAAARGHRREADNQPPRDDCGHPVTTRSTGRPRTGDACAQAANDPRRSCALLSRV